MSLRLVAIVAPTCLRLLDRIPWLEDEKIDVPFDLISILIFFILKKVVQRSKKMVIGYAKPGEKGWLVAA